MEIVFLGTSAMVPTKDRNHSGILLRFATEGILMDCGENIQRQLKIAGISQNKITRILISHWHGDHVLGIPGLLQTMAANEYDKVLQIYGPKGSKKYFEHMLKSFAFESKPELKIHEVKDGVFLETPEFKIEAFKLDHSVLTFGFAFSEKDRRRINTAYVKKLKIPDGPILGQLQRGRSPTWKGKKVDVNLATRIVKGKKIAYVSDTALCSNCVKLAKESDVLICESTHESEIEEKVRKYKHLTARQAAEIAHEANVKKLILTHFSQRYKDIKKVEDDAANIFPNTTCAYDFMKVKV